MFVKCKTCKLELSRSLKIQDTPQPAVWDLGKSRRISLEGVIYFANEPPQRGPWAADKGCLYINPDDSTNVDFDRSRRGCCAYGTALLFCRNGHKVGLICIDCYEYYVAFDSDLVITVEQGSTVSAEALNWR